MEASGLLWDLVDGYDPGRWPVRVDVQAVAAVQAAQGMGQGVRQAEELGGVARGGRGTVAEEQQLAAADGALGVVGPLRGLGAGAARR